MFSALFSFLGGSVFRMLWGEVSAFFNKQQDHAFELERLRFQESVDSAQHARNLEAIRVQADLGVKTIQVQGESVIGEIEAQGWLEAVMGTTRQSGITWVDAWNACIRPAVATWAVLMLSMNEFGLFVISGFASEVCGAALGIYLADRALSKRGK